MIKANNAANLCVRCNLFAQTSSSLYCANCDFDESTVINNPKPARKEIEICKLLECHSEAIEYGLCRAHAAGFKPAVTANVVKPAAQFKPEPEPEFKFTRYDTCLFCETPSRGGLNRLLGRCSKHQETDDENKRKCYHKGCGKRLNKFGTLYCWEHSKITQANYKYKRSERKRKPSIRGIEDVERKHKAEISKYDDDEEYY